MGLDVMSCLHGIAFQRSSTVISVNLNPCYQRSLRQYDVRYLKHGKSKPDKLNGIIDDNDLENYKLIGGL